VRLALTRLQDELTERRLRWCDQHPSLLAKGSADPLQAAYTFFLAKLRIEASDAPVAARSEHELVIPAQNFCPTLEACKLLGLDTRVVCRLVTERPADALVKRVDPRLVFNRNYERLRSYADVCEEQISIGGPRH
jgi:tRNA(adenine34) deaminase